MRKPKIVKILQDSNTEKAVRKVKEQKRSKRTQEELYSLLIAKLDKNSNDY